MLLLIALIDDFLGQIGDRHDIAGLKRAIQKGFAARIVRQIANGLAVR